MANYKVNAGDLPLPSDVNQYADALTGNNDIGQIILAAQVAAPTSAPSGTTAAGGSLGIGTYKYVVTFLTGYKKTNGTVVNGGETTASPTLTVTTTMGNMTVLLNNIPTSTSSTVIGRRIYRTQVNGSTFYKLVDILDNVSTGYTDTTADASLNTSVTPPTTNTTGTYFQAVYTGSDQRGQFFANGTTMVHLQNINGSLFCEGNGASYLCANAYYDGTNWQRFNTSTGSSAIVVQTNGEPQYRSIGSGTGPITWNTYNIFHEGNFSTRTHAAVYLNTAQSLVGNSWNRIKFDTVDLDYLTEFDTSNWWFTARNTGIYAVTFNARITGNTGTGTLRLGTNQLNRSGYAYDAIQIPISTGTGTVNLSAAFIHYLPASTQLEMRVWTDLTGLSLATGRQNTWAVITRVA